MCEAKNNTISLSQQRLDLSSAIDLLNHKIYTLKTDVSILEKGLCEIDKGGDMLTQQSILASEVRAIMRKIS
jgi:hypothetical protein